MPSKFHNCRELVAAQAKPTLSLFAFTGEREIVQAASDPLLLHVMVGNTQAISVARENQRNQRFLDRLDESELVNTLSEQELASMKQVHALQEMPYFTLGSAQTPLNDLLNFQVRAEDGSKIKVSPRLLSKYKEQINFGELKASNHFYYVFAIEASELSALKAGTYSIAVAIDTRKQENMWQGWAHSNTLNVSLSSIHPDPNWEGSSAQAAMFAHYLINDKRFEFAELHAHQWTQNHPESVDAFSYLGDALAGLNQNKKALEAYYKAAANFTLKYGENPVEIPRTLVAQIDALEELGENTQ